MMIAAFFFISMSCVQSYARPAAWCGWYARFNLVSHDPGKRFNAACAWKTWGERALSASVGAMVVWCHGSHHHVGKIVAPCEHDLCPIKSGNDGHAVRIRVRSIRGATLRVAGD